MDISAYRELINQLDAEIVAKLNQRAQLAMQIGVCKRATGLRDMQDIAREQAVIAALCRSNSGPLSDDSVAAVYRVIINECLALQVKEMGNDNP